jgi:hypothetical protein
MERKTFDPAAELGEDGGAASPRAASGLLADRYSKSDALRVQLNEIKKDMSRASRG